jgi:hypothetical protein
MRVTLNADSSLERVQALARALTVRNTSDLPGGNRALRVQVTDNASGTSAFVTKTVTVVSTNDAPRITGQATTTQNIARTATSSVTALGSSVLSFVDPFAGGVPSDMNGGTLTVSMKQSGSSSASVQLSVIGGSVGITLSGNDIIHTSGGVATTFATITSANPVSGGDLTISFNANANATRITALLKQLRVRAVSGASTGVHVLTVTLTEPDADTVSITRNFNVT